ncbi:MAG: glycosyltransferase, partial [Patescibacteria group bacterium]
MRISCHCLVKNEARFIWYSVMSVIDHVDEILVWDMESSDKTVEIINSIESKKIKFKEIGIRDSQKISELRQKMLEITEADWVFILDGDEVWSEEAIRGIENSKCDVIVIPTLML